MIKKKETWRTEGKKENEEEEKKKITAREINQQTRGVEKMPRVLT